jgi:antitoxin component YwqK of YwqJK toxin-antitoxin module
MEMSLRRMILGPDYGRGYLNSLEELRERSDNQKTKYKTELSSYIIPDLANLIIKFTVCEHMYEIEEKNQIGFMSNGKFNGNVIVLHDSGKKFFECEYMFGVKHGLLIIYSKTNVCLVGSFVNNRKEGKWIIFYQNETHIINYKNNKEENRIREKTDDIHELYKHTPGYYYNRVETISLKNIEEVFVGHDDLILIIKKLSESRVLPKLE